MRSNREAVKADLNLWMSPSGRHSVERCSDFRETVHLDRPSSQLEEGLAVAERGGAGIREGA